MSLAIDIDNVTEVLLTDGWHPVLDESFDLDSYEYLRSVPEGRGLLLHGGGENGICATGFCFKSDNGQYIAGPLTAVLAVRYEY